MVLTTEDTTSLIISVNLQVGAYHPPVGKGTTWSVLASVQQCNETHMTQAYAPILYSAVDKDLRVEMSCITVFLNCCYVCCSGAILLLQSSILRVEVFFIPFALQTKRTLFLASTN